MALRAAIVGAETCLIKNGSKLQAWNLFNNSNRFMSSHGDDHLDKQQVIDRVPSVVKSFPKVDPAQTMVPRWGRAFIYLSKLGVENCKGTQRHLPFSYRNYATVAAAVDTSTLDPHNKVSSNPQVNLNKMFWSKPCSLALPPDSPLVVEEPKYEGIKHIIFKLLLFYSKQSKSIRGANVIYGRVISQVEKPAIYNVFNLEKTFKTTFSLLVLHMWLCLRRLKAEGKDGVELRQYLYEIYNHDVELRVSKAGVNLLLTKWMKEVERIFYGNIVAYDAAMLPEAKPDELQNVIWRNIFSDDGSSVPFDSASHIVQAMTRYARREAACMSLTDKEALFSGNFVFTPLENPPGTPASKSDRVKDIENFEANLKMVKD